MSNVRAPQFVVDLVSDLRDRRLLLPAGLLLLAMIAVPLLLSSSTEPPPPPAVPAAEALTAGEETQPAVLTENITVRDYRKRLDELKSTNPFEAGFKPPKGAGAGAAALDDLLPPGGTGSGGGTSTATDTAATTSDSNIAPTGTSSPSTSTSTSSGSSGGGSGGGGGGGGDPEIRFYAHEIDVKTGETGDLEARNGVEDLTLLPKDAKPVVMFLGVNTGGNRAVFLVSDDVSSTSGDGSCAPSGADCDFLTLREGESQTFDYVPDGKTYKLVLKKIQTVRVG